MDPKNVKKITQIRKDAKDNATYKVKLTVYKDGQPTTHTIAEGGNEDAVLLVFESNYNLLKIVTDPRLFTSKGRSCAVLENVGSKVKVELYMVRSIEQRM